MLPNRRQEVQRLHNLRMHGRARARMHARTRTHPRARASSQMLEPRRREVRLLR